MHMTRQIYLIWEIPGRDIRAEERLGLLVQVLQKVLIVVVLGQSLQNPLRCAGGAVIRNEGNHPPGLGLSIGLNVAFPDDDVGEAGVIVLLVGGFVGTVLGTSLVAALPAKSSVTSKPS